jgi:hypothetical protein
MDQVRALSSRPDSVSHFKGPKELKRLKNLKELKTGVERGPLAAGFIFGICRLNCGIELHGP